ncbi:MAG TPA: hypothetical protein VNW90_25190 [Acetobacteraceae bacterium]|jgi:hypothetical protein|nr:hypothetical protein [Acetobacteraceae bacterium]
MVKVEMLPVPPEYVDKFMKGVYLTTLRKIPGYDLKRTHQRLLVGLDQLWVACSPQACSSIWGVVITTISDRPPSKRKCFERQDPALMRSLTVHIAGEYYLGTWLESAIERIIHYARQQGCRQLFLLFRKNWQRRILRPFFSAGWEAVAISRDRPTKSTCKVYRHRNTPGHFRIVIPIPAKRFTRHMYHMTGRFYLKEEEAAA